MIALFAAAIAGLRRGAHGDRAEWFYLEGGLLFVLAALVAPHGLSALETGFGRRATAFSEMAASLFYPTFSTLARVAIVLGCVPRVPSSRWAGDSVLAVSYLLGTIVLALSLGQWEKGVSYPLLTSGCVLLVPALLVTLCRLVRRNQSSRPALDPAGRLYLANGLMVLVLGGSLAFGRGENRVLSIAVSDLALLSCVLAIIQDRLSRWLPPGSTPLARTGRL